MYSVNILPSCSHISCKVYKSTLSSYNLQISPLPTWTLLHKFFECFLFYWLISSTLWFLSHGTCLSFFLPFFFFFLFLFLAPLSPPWLILEAAIFPLLSFYFVLCFPPHFLEVVAIHMASSCSTQGNSISAIFPRSKLEFLPSRPKGKPIGKSWWVYTLPL